MPTCGPRFDRVRSSVRPGENVYVVDRQGDYLVHPDRAREFGSQLGKPTDWRSDFPASGAAGWRDAKHRADPAGSGRTPGGIALAPALLAGSEWVAVIEPVPNAVFMAPAAAIRTRSLLVGLIAVLCAAALAVLIARSLTRPIVQLTAAVEGAGRNGTAAIPVDAGGETGVLARAFARVMGEAECQNRRARTRGRGASPHRSRARPSCRARAPVQRRGRILQRRHHHEVARRHDHRLESGRGTAVRIYRGGSRRPEHHAHRAADRLPEVQDTLRRIGWGERIEHNETVRLRKDGSRVEVSLSISPIKAPSGAIIGISKTARDITEANRTGTRCDSRPRSGGASSKPRRI